MELTEFHPQSSLNDLWLRFHGLERPTRPTADDAMDVLRHAGLEPERRDWTAEPAGGFAEKASLVAWIRRRLCLSPERDPEVEEAIQGRIERTSDGSYGLDSRDLVTVWWPGGPVSSAGRQRRCGPATAAHRLRWLWGRCW